MTDEDRIEEALGVYNMRYRTAFQLGASYEISRDWHDRNFPDAERAGCYLFFDEDRKLVYIGKCSLNHSLGRRIASYFVLGPESRSPQARHSWDAAPFYLRTIPVERAYEAPSLEEYLIEVLQPPANTHKGHRRA